MQILTGRCLCEGIAYEIRGELGPIFHCHCSRCRRWHGAAFRTRATINASQFTWTRGEELLSRYHSSEFVVKHFCSVCGSNLISTYDDDPAKVGVPLGGLDQAPSNAPEGTSSSARRLRGSRSPTDCRSTTPGRVRTPGSARPGTIRVDAVGPRRGLLLARRRHRHETLVRWRAVALPGNRGMEEGRMLRTMVVAALAVGV